MNNNRFGIIKAPTSNSLCTVIKDVSPRVNSFLSFMVAFALSVMIADSNICVFAQQANHSKSIKYETISATIPTNWTYQGQVANNGHTVSVDFCPIENINDICNIVVARPSTKTAREMLELAKSSYFGNLPEAKYGQIQECTFKGHEACSMDFTYRVSGITMYGKCYSYREGNAAVQLFKVTDNKSHLDSTSFQMIENSFKIQ